MICYGDKTFCDAKECGHYSKCSLAVTDKVVECAEAIGLPIAVFINPKKLDCYIDETGK